MGRFTDKQKAAADHYLVHKRKKEAYRHAYRCGNMKENTISRRADELFKLPLVAEYVVQQQEAIQEHTQINAAWVLKRAALLADFNIRRFINIQPDGTAVYDFSEATDDDWYCIDEYTVDTIHKGPKGDTYEVDRVKLKTTAKIRALELVGKHIDVGAFKDTLDLTGTLTTETYELSDTERSARIAALLDRGRTRRTGQADN